MSPDALVDRQDDDALLTVEDAAAFLHVPISWVYEHVRPESRDRLPFVKLGKYLRFDRRDLRAWIDAMRARFKSSLASCLCWFSSVGSRD